MLWESEADDSGFICAALRFVPWVDTTTASEADVVKVVVTMFFLTSGEAVGTDEKETVSEITTALLLGVLCVLICAVFNFSDASAGAVIPAPVSFPGDPVSTSISSLTVTVFTYLVRSTRYTLSASCLFHDSHGAECFSDCLQTHPPRTTCGTLVYFTDERKTLSFLAVSRRVTCSISVYEFCLETTT